MKIGDLVKSEGTVRTIADLALRPSAVKKLADVLTAVPAKLQKRRVQKRLRKYAAPANTMESLISQVREPAITSVPCEAPPAKSGMPYREGSHWLSVVGTEPDRVIVHCDDENKTWAVPYSINDNEVVTGDPEEVGITFTPVNEDEDETGDDEAEGGETDPEGTE